MHPSIFSAEGLAAQKSKRANEHRLGQKLLRPIRDSCGFCCSFVVKLSQLRQWNYGRNRPHFVVVFTAELSAGSVEVEFAQKEGVYLVVALSIHACIHVCAYWPPTFSTPSFHFISFHFNPFPFESN